MSDAPTVTARTITVGASRLPIRDAATLMLIDYGTGGPRILMGRRRADLAFLANKFVFPGGRVDVADKATPSADALSLDAERLLLQRMRGRPSPARARALAIAAIRETREETGLIFSDRDRPSLASLSFFARAITPPGRARRYDTRFFIADTKGLTTTELAGDGELTDLAWFRLSETRLLDLPRITRLVLDDLEAHLESRHVGHQVPFYFEQRGVSRREVMTLPPL
jgi:8-oxo-dGTP pyrophosphatase MutT (NUDIX family)